MKILLGFALLFSLLVPVQALPTGTWIADYNGVIGTVDFASTNFKLVVSEGENVAGFSGPVVIATEPEAARPGRAIVGPVTGSRATYEVVWYFNPEGSRARFYFADQGFATVKEAEAAQAQFALEEADPFMSEEFYQKVSALPAMPELSRDQFVALLSDALQSRKASTHKDTDLQMDDLVIARGYDPVKSHDAFDKALEAYGEDAEVKSLLDELAK